MTALVYLHDTLDRQRTIAAAVSDLVRKQLGTLAASLETAPKVMRTRWQR